MPAGHRDVPPLDRLASDRLTPGIPGRTHCLFAFAIGQGFLLGITLYVALPSLMVFLSLVLPVKITRLPNVVLPVIYGLTIVGGAVGEWSYYILGSAIEAALLAGIVYYAWTWPKTAAAARLDERASHRV